MKTSANVLSLFLLMIVSITTKASSDTCNMEKMYVERLPNLNIPRMGHTVFCINGEVVAAGGHTTGFVSTPTAEYYAKGAWHTMPLTYPHDQGGMIRTKTGEVLLFGGHERELGIGQTFTIERYDAAAHNFIGHGCLEKKRCFSNTLPLSNGNVIISGNWYHDDCIEMYDGSRQNTFVKNVSQQRSLPHILRTARDNAIIFSARDIRANVLDTIIIDRLKGEPFTVQFFETWRPYCYPIGYQGSCFIGDESKDEFVNLIQVTQGDSLMAIARVEGEAFSLLPTTCPIPMRSQWGPIKWFCHLLADKKTGRAYIEGYGENKSDHRIYVAAIDYMKSPSPVTLYYSEPQDSVGRVQPVLTDSGDLMLVGGALEHDNNYDASPTVFLLHVKTEKSVASQDDRKHVWLWPFIALLLFAGGIVAVQLKRRSRKAKRAKGKVKATEKDATATTDAEKKLMERICKYMDEEQPYLNNKLKIQDLSETLDSNRTYISNSIKSIRGCSFTQFINTYRIRHAQQILREQRNVKISAVWSASGFSSEASFFRIFKDITGMTPREWIDAGTKTEQ